VGAPGGEGASQRIERNVRRQFAVIPLAAVVFAAGCSGGGGSASDPAPPATETGGRDPAFAGDWKTDFSKHTVPLAGFVSGGPGKDGIPALDRPRFESVAEADRWIEDKEPVIELVIADEARAYPLQILTWHEIVNDELGGRPVAVTFCPLCNTALVFDRRVDGRLLDFGTTGYLRNSDLVMYDRQTESWWQQFGGDAVIGELAGEELEQVPAAIVAWREFADRHPGARVLSRETGFPRPYGRNPYSGYDDVGSPPFVPTENSDDDRLQPKERVVYVERKGKAAAVPFSVLAKAGRMEVEIGGDVLALEWVPGARSALDHPAIAAGREVGSARVRLLGSGEPVAFDTPFWFAVAAFRPDVRVVGRPSAQGASERSRYSRVPGLFPVQA
jgi:Protein of unknown function (DUF3179)